MKGRKRLPLTVLKLRGSLKAHPERAARRTREPKQTGMLNAEPPIWMDDYERNVYQEIVHGCHKDTLTTGDQGLVEALACLVAEFRQCKPRSKFNVAKIGKILACYSLLGLTPVDRSRANVIKREEQDDEYAAFAR